MKHIYVMNPAAGDGSHYRPLVEEIRQVYEGSGILYGIYTTKGPGDAFQFLSGMKKDATYRIFACGGDGTLNEVVNGIKSLKEVELGLVPCGSGNDFVKNFTHPEYFLDIRRQQQAVSTPIDYIETNIGACLNICSLGLDAKVGRNFMKFKGLPGVSGPMAYNLALPYSVLSKLGWHTHMVVDGEELEGKNIITVVAGGVCYGGGYYGAPKARIDDGLIDVVAIKNVSRLRLLRFISRFKNGSFIDDADFAELVTYRRAKSLELVMKKPVPVCMDGECSTVSVLTAGIVPGGLSFCLPEGSDITGYQPLETA